MGTIRVLLVDDQQIVRQGLATILKYAEGIEVADQAGDGQEAIALARDLRPDVVLMDVKMPRLGGIPATRQICAELPGTHVIILTTYDTDDLVFEGIKAGAEGYLLKDASGEMLVEAIRGVMRGESQIDPGVARKVLSEFQRLAEQPAASQPESRQARDPRPDAVIEPLTPREEEVLELLVEGLSNKEIGARLHLTEGTVKNYVSTIIAKLQANDRTHAVVTALRRGLVDLGSY
jgi:RNA polymerase sigma factor (sigma-70 family)